MCVHFNLKNGAQANYIDISLLQLRSFQTNSTRVNVKGSRYAAFQKKLCSVKILGFIDIF